MAAFRSPGMLVGLDASGLRTGGIYRLSRNPQGIGFLVFLAGFERAFMLFMDSCGFCKECSGSRETCSQPHMARPAPEAMAVDVYSTVSRFGFPINVRTDYEQKMDRYAFLMVH